VDKRLSPAGPAPSPIKHTALPLAPAVFPKEIAKCPTESSRNPAEELHAPWTAVGSDSATPLWMFHQPSSSAPDPPQKNPKRYRRCTLPPHSTHSRPMDCGGKQSATPLWMFHQQGLHQPSSSAPDPPQKNPKRYRRCTLPPHSMLAISARSGRLPGCSRFIGHMPLIIGFVSVEPTW
jgi:hypothetical protein